MAYISTYPSPLTHLFQGLASGRCCRLKHPPSKTLFYISCCDLILGWRLTHLFFLYVNIDSIEALTLFYNGVILQKGICILIFHTAHRNGSWKLTLSDFESLIQLKCIKKKKILKIYNVQCIYFKWQSYDFLSINVF